MQTKNLSLLQAKIAGLRTALFFCDNQQDLSYSAHIIEVETMDEHGCIWFNVNKHNGQGVQAGELFPVSLDFYRKGVSYTIDIKGMASIEEVTGDKLLLKITIGKLLYKDLTAAASVPMLETIGRLFRCMFCIPEPMDEFAVTD
jgi:hypothetical protein